MRCDRKWQILEDDTTQKPEVKTGTRTRSAGRSDVKDERWRKPDQYIWISDWTHLDLECQLTSVSHHRIGRLVTFDPHRALGVETSTIRRIPIIFLLEFMQDPLLVNIDIFQREILLNITLRWEITPVSGNLGLVCREFRNVVPSFLCVPVFLLKMFRSFPHTENIVHVRRSPLCSSLYLNLARVLTTQRYKSRSSCFFMLFHVSAWVDTFPNPYFDTVAWEILGILSSSDCLLIHLFFMQDLMLLL